MCVYYFTLLSILEDKQSTPLRITTIAKRTGNSFRTQSEALKGLVDLGMVEQHTQLNDRVHSRLFCVTDKGKRFVSSFTRMRNIIEIGPGLKVQRGTR